MTGSALLNAFKVLHRKPAVLLLLFPFYSFAPLLLMLIPINNAKGLGTNETSLIMLIVLLAILLVIFIALARSVLLVSPAMELLKDGAAGVDTPSGWYLRSLKKHWWKSLSIGFIQWTISESISFIFQIACSMIFPVLIVLCPSLMNQSTFEVAGIPVLPIIIFGAAYLLLFIVIFVLESLSAYLLAALADRSFGKAVKVIFSRLGFSKLPKLLGGRLLTSFISILIVVSVLMTCGLYPYFTQVTASNQFVFDLIIALISICWFLVSCIDIYKFSFDFCVFQQVKITEAIQTKANNQAS